jgi:hypothetical protein
MATSYLRSVRIVCGGIVVVAALIAGGCSSNNDTPVPPAPVAKPETPGASLRVGLNNLMREHALLLAATTDAAFGGRKDEFNAAANALDANSQELATAIGTYYGADGRTQFYELWHKHIGFVWDYARALDAKDDAGEKKAASDLIEFSADFGSWLENATAGRMKKDAVSDLAKTHVAGVLDIVNAQSRQDFASAYTAERDAEKQMGKIADLLADAIADQFPDKF